MIRETLNIPLPDCPRCGAKAHAFKEGGYGYWKAFVGCSRKGCEMHNIERFGDNARGSDASNLNRILNGWRNRVKNYDQGRSPLVIIEPINMELTIDLHCPRCREKIVITRNGMDCYHTDFNYPCPHCDEKIDVRLPKWSE